MFAQGYQETMIVFIAINLLKMQCNSLKALELFNTSITSNESVVAIVGCGCSLATEKVASRSDIPVVRELLKLDIACHGANLG